MIDVIVSDALIALLLVSVVMPLVVSLLMFIGNATRCTKHEPRAGAAEEAR